MRFAVNADRALTAGEQSVLRSTWEDAFVEIDPVRLKSAFIATLRSHTFKTIPTVGDVLQHVQHARENDLLEEAARKWEQVVTFAAGLSDDYPDRRKTNILPRTQAAIRGAGGLRHIRDCKTESLEWARKNFMQAYIRYSEIERDQALLPDGELKAMLVQVAADKALPAGAGAPRTH